MLPGWVKARGMSFYLVVFQGGNAIGSVVMGVAAQHIGLSPTLLMPRRRWPSARSPDCATGSGTSQRSSSRQPATGPRLRRRKTASRPARSWSWSWSNTGRAKDSRTICSPH
jgi:hypothetical protein